MTNIVKGPNIYLRFNSNELNDHFYNYTLPEGYSINIMHITHSINILIINEASSKIDNKLVFPVVNSKSPSIIQLYIADVSKEAAIRFTIEKFGQIPDPHYFDGSFKSILVTGEDGNEYKVIPSDQFK